MCEDAPCCGCCGAAENPEYYTGPGSGEDDLADFNDNEADDYRNEGGDDGVAIDDSPDGGEDAHLDNWDTSG